MQLLDRPSVEELPPPRGCVVAGVTRTSGGSVTALGHLPGTRRQPIWSGRGFQILRPAHCTAEFSIARRSPGTSSRVWHRHARRAPGCCPLHRRSQLGSRWLMSPQLAEDIWGADLRRSASRRRMSRPRKRSPLTAATVSAGAGTSWRVRFGHVGHHWCDDRRSGTGELEHNALFVAPGDYHIVPDTWNVLGLRRRGQQGFHRRRRRRSALSRAPDGR